MSIFVAEKLERLENYNKKNRKEILTFTQAQTGIQFFSNILATV